jgi:hypothetical protein
MRSVDILYGLPYILLVILTKIAFEQPLTALLRYPQARELRRTRLRHRRRELADDGARHPRPSFVASIAAVHRSLQGGGVAGVAHLHQAPPAQPHRADHGLRRR